MLQQSKAKACHGPTRRLGTKEKVFNQDMFFMIMNLVKTRNLKTIGIGERREIQQWELKRRHTQRISPVHYSREKTNQL